MTLNIVKSCEKTIFFTYYYIMYLTYASTK
jgi:hypothetical protein